MTFTLAWCVAVTLMGESLTGLMHINEHGIASDTPTFTIAVNQLSTIAQSVERHTYCHGFHSHQCLKKYVGQGSSAMLAAKI